MPEVTVYEPPLGCSTGYCGPDGEDTLEAFGAVLEGLARAGVHVERYNLGHHPGAFAGNPQVRGMLTSEGIQCLPLVIVDGEVACKGAYPGRADFHEALAARGIEVKPAGPVEAGTSSVADR